jgi:hypothetical protein
MDVESAGWYQHVFPYGLGVFLGVAIIYAARRMRSDERWFLTWLMAVVVVGFVGFPLAAGDTRGIAAEVVVIVVLGALLAWSWLRRSALLLALVYIAHGASDVAHLIGDVSPANPAWIHQFCVPFDWLLGAYVLVRRSSWRTSTVGDDE